MSTLPTGMARLRRLGVVVVAAAAVLAAAGCSVTSHVTHCENGTCTVKLTGAGSSAELGSGGSTVILVSAGDGVANLQLAGAEGSCTEGETIELAELTVECTKVGDDSVELIVNE